MAATRRGYRVPRKTNSILILAVAALLASESYALDCAKVLGTLYRAPLVISQVVGKGLLDAKESLFPRVLSREDFLKLQETPVGDFFRVPKPSANTPSRKKTAPEKRADTLAKEEVAGALRDIFEGLSASQKKTTTPTDKALRVGVAEEFARLAAERDDGRNAVGSLKLASDEVDRFQKTFDDYLRAHGKYSGDFHHEKEFKKWWGQFRRGFLNRPTVEAMRAKDVNVEQTVRMLHDLFMLDRERPSMFKRAARVLTSPYLIAGVGASMATKLWGFFYSLMVLGPGVQTFNAYTESVVTPVAQTAGQQGAKDLSVAAEFVQSMLTSPPTLDEEEVKLADAKKIKNEVEDFSKSIDSLTPEQMSKQWEEVEKGYFEFMMRFKKKLPAHMRDGRAYAKDLTNQLVSTGSWAVGVDTNYWTHKGFADTLEALREKSGPLTKKQEDELGFHREQMDADLERMAGVLVAWKLYDVMYPEFTRVSEAERAKFPLLNIYEVINHSMRFDVYMKAMKKQMNQRLGLLLSEFQTQVEEAEHLKKAGVKKLSGNAIHVPAIKGEEGQ